MKPMRTSNSMRMSIATDSAFTSDLKLCSMFLAMRAEKRAILVQGRAHWGRSGMRDLKIGKTTDAYKIQTLLASQMTWRSLSTAIPMNTDTSHPKRPSAVQGIAMQMQS